MPELLLYLLKVNVALVLFYLAYHVALRRLTFYHLNRLFLVFGIVFSTVYPFINLSELFADHEPIAKAYIVTIPAWALTNQTIAHAPTFDYWQLLVYLFWAGVTVMLVRFIVQFVSLYKIHAASEPANYKSIGFRQVKTISHAFSFWQTIYINPEQHKREELESILHHELIHITGWHTLDVMLAELSTVFYWFNPGTWLIKKAVKENLEFIADQNVVNTGVDKKEYQYLLLKVVGATQPQIANQFNFPSLKRRIAMMNKMPSTKKHLLKFLAVVPVAAVLLLIFGNITQSQANTVDVTGYTKLGPDIYIKQGPTFQSACWTAPNTLTITPVNGGEAESYQLDNEQDVATAIREYGLYLPDNELYEKILANKTETIKQTNTDAENIQDTALPKELVEHLKKNPAIKSVRGKKIDNRSAVVISLKGGGTEVYYLTDEASIAELERKYGLPELPPPPPPAPDAPDAPPAPPADKNSSFIFSVEDSPYYKDNLPADYKEFLKRNPQVNQLGWKFSDMIDYNLESVVIYLKNGKTETYDFNQNPRIPAVEAKYGQLPSLPPPPPPVRVNLPAPPPPVQKKAEQTSGLPESAVYYIDGVEASPEAVKKIDPKQIHSVNVIKGETAKKILGDKAGNGVVSITTNKNKDAEKVAEFNRKLGTLPTPPPLVRSKSTDKRESSVTKPATRNTYAQIDTLNGTAAQIKKLLYARQKAGEPAVDNLILFTKNSKGQGIDVYAKLDGTTIKSVKVLATAN